jgi:hypothetical protein
MVNHAFKSMETGRVTKVWANTRILKGVTRMEANVIRGLLEEGNGGVKTVSNVIDFGNGKS